MVFRRLPENVSERRGTDWNAVMDKAAAWGADDRLSECIEKLDVNGCPDKWLDMLRAMLPTPGAPVPPRQVLQQCSEDFFSDDSGMRSTEFGFRQGAAWGHAQAIPEREELSRFLYDLAEFIGSSPLEGALGMEARTRAAAERLGGGSSDV